MAKTQNMNLVKLVDMFHSEDSCRQYLEELRWPAGVACTRCDHTSVTSIEERGQYSCNRCSYQFSVTSGTMMHDTHLPLWKWFLAVYTICESKKGVSSNQLKRMLDVSHKTAWYLSHRIRAAMTEVDAPKLGGIVEVDETFVGGRRRNVRHGYTGTKAIVVGAVERDGEVRMTVAEDRTRKTLAAFIRANVDPATKRIMTDEWGVYPNMTDRDTLHERVNHFLKEYVRGDVHTNTVEGVWSLLKRSIIGSFHHVSEKHLNAYLNELEWRYNNRHNDFLFRDTLKQLIGSEHVEYKELTAG